MQLTSGKIQKAQRIVIYGPEGIGKTTLANQFPKPVFIDIEDSTSWMDVNRLPCESWQDILNAVKYLKTEKHGFKTVVLDTADWAERFCVSFVCGNAGKTSIAAFDHGKGYTYIDEEFGRLLTSLNALVKSGVNVIFVAHCTVKNMELPNENGSFDHYELKCSKRISPLLKEWAEAVLFINYKVTITENENGKTKAIGGRKRIIHTQHTAAYDAKNRSDLPDQIPFELPFDFKLLAKVLGDGVKKPESPKVDAFAEAIEGIDAGNGKNVARDYLVSIECLKKGEAIQDLHEKHKAYIVENLESFKQAIAKWLDEVRSADAADNSNKLKKEPENV